MKVLVTGGGGFIGSHIVEFYSNNGDEVIAFDNLMRDEFFKLEGSLTNWNYLRSLSNVTLVKGDVRDFSKLKEIAVGCEVIFHTAAQVAVTKSLEDPAIDFEINAKGTLNVLELARIVDAAVIYTSTNKVYGENVNKIPLIEIEKKYQYADPKYKNGIPEDFPIDLTGHSPYGCSKLAADLYAQDYAHIYGLKTGVFRQSCIYGERQFGVEDQGWIAWFIFATLTDKLITIYGNGKQVRDVLHVRELIRAFDMFLRSNLKHEVFNVGGGPENTISLLELLDLLKKMTGKYVRVSFSSWRTADQKVYVSDISKIKKMLNWRPFIGFEEGIIKIIKEIQERS